LPATLLLTALVIVTTSALRGSKSGFIISIIMICTLATLGIHEAQSLNIPSWRYDEISLTDVIAYSILFMFISMIAWLSNREIDNSLQEARRAKN
jgi:tRNA-binding EMAP/Myf-like protein